ncbi:hypothetical protein H8K20_03560 [Neobittarella massiliensis]|uniref:Uncharacterized protein n=1 Tax=Neobittarella massiliensis (ex Bilen et al. 2018) TaxID=2041842 RepID=A0A8J6LU97_9FIRM|nr:hypothetical protein [Neobittarella massiliensis]MBC3515475.1 hypothetical protein [Neobittarella massiliensis]
MAPYTHAVVSVVAVVAIRFICALLVAAIGATLHLKMDLVVLLSTVAELATYWLAVRVKLFRIMRELLSYHFHVVAVLASMIAVLSYLSLGTLRTGMETSISPKDYFLFFLLVILMIATIISWTKDKYRAKVVREELRDAQRKSEDLARKMHRDAAVIPALRGMAKTMARGIELGSIAPEERRAWIEEIARLTEEQGEETRKNDMQQNRESIDTGLLALDFQVEHFFDLVDSVKGMLTVNVREPIDVLVREHIIPERALLSLIGNLMRNACRAVKDRPVRDISLILGYLGGDYSITVGDTGEPFLPAVLFELGRPGNTTRGAGHGNGLYEIAQTLESTGASLHICEWTDGAKDMMVIFDGRHETVLASYRAEDLFKMAPEGCELIFDQI